MATVYRAYEPALDRHVALKVLPREFLHDPGFAERFTREARAIARLEHPNIVPIYAYDIDREEGIPWMALRLVGSADPERPGGGALSEILKRGLVGPRRAVEILRGVADALDHAHAKGVVHRDVKPQNVLLDEDGRVYLADFGIARMLESSGGLTATGMITGTPQYMAPEQATGTKVGPAADVYALGIVAYEMLTGRVPFAADTPVAIMMKHVQEPLPLPPLSKVQAPLLQAILRCTAKRPEERWPSAGAFVSALEAGLEALAPPTVVVPTLALPPTRGGARRPRTARPFPPCSSASRSRACACWPRRPAWPCSLLRGAPSRASSSPAPTGVVAATPLPGRRSLAGAFARLAFPAVRFRPEGGLSGAPARRRHLRRRSPHRPRPPRLWRPLRRPAPALAPPSAITAPPTTTAPAVDPEIQRLAAALAETDPAVRRRAAQDLATLGPEAAPALTALTAALGDRTVDVRLRAAEALGAIGPGARAAVPALAQALRDPDPMVRGEAAKSLGLMGEAASPAAGPLGEALGNPEVAVRREAARALARVGRGAEPALGALLRALEDKDKTVRAQAARALGRIGPPARAGVAALTAMSRDSDVIVSREARAALESIGP